MASPCSLDIFHKVGAAAMYSIVALNPSLLP